MEILVKQLRQGNLNKCCVVDLQMILQRKEEVCVCVCISCLPMGLCNLKTTKYVEEKEITLITNNRYLWVLVRFCGG